METSDVWWLRLSHAEVSCVRAEVVGIGFLGVILNDAPQSCNPNPNQSVFPWSWLAPSTCKRFHDVSCEFHVSFMWVSCEFHFVWISMEQLFSRLQILTRRICFWGSMEYPSVPCLKLSVMFWRLWAQFFHYFPCTKRSGFFKHKKTMQGCLRCSDIAWGWRESRRWVIGLRSVKIIKLRLEQPGYCTLPAMTEAKPPKSADWFNTNDSCAVWPSAFKSLRDVDGCGVWGIISYKESLQLFLEFNLPTCRYGSIPINTIFSGMNIHLPAILGFTRYHAFDPSPCVASCIETLDFHRQIDRMMCARSSATELSKRIWRPWGCQGHPETDRADAIDAFYPLVN